MAATRKSENWFLIKKKTGVRDIVKDKFIVNRSKDTKVGSLAVNQKPDGSHEIVTIVGISHDRQMLEKQLYANAEAVENKENSAGPSHCEEDQDFSASASDWEPSEENPSTDDEEIEQKKLKKDRLCRTSLKAKSSSKVLRPSHRADAVNAFLAKYHRTNSTKTQSQENMNDSTEKKHLPDSTRANNSPVPNQKSDIVSINVKDIMYMKQCFHKLFGILKELKPLLSSEKRLDNTNNSNSRVNTSHRPKVKSEVNNTLLEDTVEDDYDSNRSEDLNRSDDNILITNKYENANNQILLEKNKNQNSDPNMVRLGGGSTMISKEVYKKVNWKSYTVATRSLLLAVFSRRTLATHSLTGKKSPAFQDKPAKAILDRKKVNDIIAEICDRFDVRENLVRTIITTKCADECKMFKQRKAMKVSKQNKPQALPTKQENIKMDVDANENETNHHDS